MRHQTPIDEYVPTFGVANLRNGFRFVSVKIRDFPILGVEATAGRPLGIRQAVASDPRAAPLAAALLCARRFVTSGLVVAGLEAATDSD